MTLVDFWRYFQCWWVARRYPGYRPQPVTTASVMRWLEPYTPKERTALLKFLKTLVYLSEDKTREILVSLNTALLRYLNDSGIPPRDIAYVQVHDAGSSSPVILNILKDYSHLQRLKCQLIDSKDATKLAAFFRAREQGAVVYVDDFAGTGNQLCSVRDVLAPIIPTTFVEFVIMPAMCEEAFRRLAARGVEPRTHYIHSRGDRPLNDSSTILRPEMRSLLQDLCARVVPPIGLGYEGIASHIVLYRSAPNTIPAILRGSRGQKPFPGLFPRADDFEPVRLGPPGAVSPKSQEKLFKVKDEATQQLSDSAARSPVAGSDQLDQSGEREES